MSTGRVLAFWAFLFFAVVPAAFAAERRKPRVRAPSPLSQGPRPTTIPEGMKEGRETLPWFLRPILKPLKNGMLIRLPIIDTNPNRGITYGVMPIWVFKEPGGERITQIHAPSATYNRFFGWTGTYRYYYYPKPDSSLVLRASASQVVNREAYAKFEDFSFLRGNCFLSLKGVYDVDGSGRFFGLGPDSRSQGQSNYTRDVIGYNGVINAPFYGRWYVNASHRLEANRIADGPIHSLPALITLYPGLVPARRHQNSALRLFLSYDSRDNPVTTSRGAFLEFFGETSQREALASEYDYHRYGSDLRYFYKNPAQPQLVTAADLRFEQVLGDGVPFWLLPQLGGKYVHRAYGEGRYVDKGLLTSTVEERVNFYERRLAGVATQFQVAPFAGLGTVFESPGRMARRYARPVFGAALRAIAAPQVVGSIDFGVGQEGLATFMDINYSF